MNIKDKAFDCFIEYAKDDAEGALMLITGLFVALNARFVEDNGRKGDGNKEINIKGPDGQREITIHPVKGHD